MASDSIQCLNPITDGALRPSKWPPNDPKFRDFSYFHMTYMKSKKIWVFHSDFGYLEGGGGEHPPPLNVYFQPRPK